MADKQHTNISLGFSPCPNDCYIFDALIHHKIDTEGLSFNVTMQDVEDLNQGALNEELDVTKLSFSAFAHCTNAYELLDAGGALGRGCGPLLIAKDTITLSENSRVAIPGKYTTANFLLSIAYPHLNNKKEYLFSEIEEAVLNNEVDAGLIIHENRFTYQEKGLVKLIDLGEFWEQETKLPIPLGGIVIKRSLPEEIKLKVNRVLKKSVEYAFAQPKASVNFVREHAQEMSEEVMYQHINLYVNDFSVDMGTEGKNAVSALFEKAQALGVVQNINKPIFLS